MVLIETTTISEPIRVREQDQAVADSAQGFIKIQESHMQDGLFILGYLQGEYG
jgi:hypothetical protein